VPEKDFYTTAEFAKLLGVSRIAVFNKIKKGEVKAQKMGRNFVILKKDVQEIEKNSSSLFKIAKKWAVTREKIPDKFYCQNSAIFQTRLVKMETLLQKDKNAKDLFSLLTSIAGEIGNNSFDHNLGQWPDIPGIFFGYDLNKKQIVLADRGLGILQTLKRVRPALKNHLEALKTAFTEIISGRSPESRGNGLKYVRHVIVKYPINLVFETGNAKLKLNNGNHNLIIEDVMESINGCLALITW